MPTSHFNQLQDVVGMMVYLDPQSILDVGCGCGKYGVLAREYLELALDHGPNDPWRRRMEAIEGFGGYLTPLHKFIYDQVHVGNALEIMPKLDGPYDLVLLIDTLEHLERDAGLELLRQCRRLGRNVIVSTPHRPARQGAELGNPLEQHRSRWTRADLAPFGPALFVPHEDSLIALLGQDTEMIRHTLRYQRVRRFIRLYAPFLKFIYRRMRKSNRISPRADVWTSS
ncbi:MAG: class I SAM-dependent methyltransferase [Verrucomicrobiae bacterium]|nr:class I SAM-dependent methyltransferase [Verrucomicrobiae bacterium]